jgi:hypothetical protein
MPVSKLPGFRTSDEAFFDNEEAAEDHELKLNVPQHNAAHRIDGYYNPPRPGQSAESVEKAFLRAKTICLNHMAIAFQQTASLTLDEFLQVRKQGFFNLEEPPAPAVAGDNR